MSHEVINTQAAKYDNAKPHLKDSSTYTKQHFFITGTDTDVGKTYIATALLARAKEQGHSCYGVKPLTAGCELLDNKLISADAEKIAEVSSKKIHADLLAPVKLTTACSPNIAATIDNKHITASRLTGMVRGSLSKRASHVLVEGAGGWYTPINDRETLADVAKEIGLPVILVVGIKLGCLNHALLTLKAIQASGLKLAGWVANEPQANTEFFDEQVQTLATFMPVPKLGEVRFGELAKDKVQWLDELMQH